MTNAAPKRGPSAGQNALLLPVEIALFAMLWLGTLGFIGLFGFFAAQSQVEPTSPLVLAVWEAYLAKWLHSNVGPLPSEFGKRGFLVLAFPIAWLGYLWAARLLGGRTLGQWFVPHRLEVPTTAVGRTWQLVVLISTLGAYETKVPFPPTWRLRYFVRSLVAGLFALYLCIALAATMIFWADQ